MKDKLFNQYRYLGSNKNNYFEGWYYKQVSKDKKNTVSFIIGVSKSDDSHSFIQVLDNIYNKSYYFRYDIDDFEYSNNPFYIKIKDSYFSLDRIIINIENIVDADIKISNISEIDKSIYAPNIMGPFAYIPFMKCNHGVISLSHNINGFIKINKKEIIFDDGLGYIEKDYGSSFPEKYMWLQSNSLDSDDASIFLSVAKIPFGLFSFKGFISILKFEDRQYRFSTYYFGKVDIFRKNQNEYSIKIKQFSYILIINVKCGEEIELVSPNNGLMKDAVNESLSSVAEVVLYKKDKELFRGKFLACGSEFML